MSAIKPLPSVANKATFSFVCSLQTRKICRGWQLGPDIAFVRGTTQLYLDIRNTPVDRSNPLTEEEMRRQVICKTHAHGILDVFPVLKTFGLMARWAQENALKEKKIQERVEALKSRLASGVSAAAPTVTKGYTAPEEKKFGPPIQRESGKRKKVDGKKKDKQPQHQKKGR